MTRTASLHLTILPGEGYIVENRGGAFAFIRELQGRGLLGSMAGRGAYLDGIHRLSNFIHYARNHGFTVTTSV